LSISHSLNSRTKPYPQEDLLEEFRATSKPGLEDEARIFIEEEADPSEEEPLHEFVVPPKPPIELKPLPIGLRYAFLGDDLESPAIISDKVTQEQTLRLMAMLEKHHSVDTIFGHVSFDSYLGLVKYGSADEAAVIGL